VLGIVQDKVYKTWMTDLDDLEHRIRTQWAKLDDAVIAAAVHQWSCRFSECVKAGGSLSSTVFDLDIVFSAITTTFLAVIDQSNSCTPIGRFGLVAFVSYDFVLCNTLRLSNSLGKVLTLIR